MAKTGRPKITIDQKIFENLCAIQCTEVEICSCFDCCEDTLNKWCKENYKNEDGKPMTFSEVFAVKRQKGRASLRRAQFRLAQKNASMAIWLGKQYLDQKDEAKLETESRISIDPLSKSLEEMAKGLESDG